MKIADKLWNWGHLEGSHNRCVKQNCTMTPEGFAEEYGIRRAFIVSYGGNIQPPFDALAKRFSTLDEVKWSVLGDASTPLPDCALGNTPDVCAAAKNAPVITGGVVDDFFSPARLAHFPPETLMQMKEELHANGLDFWCVLYSHETDRFAPYVDCFDGVTFWVWSCAELESFEETLDGFLCRAGKTPVMAGVYLWDYSTGKPMDTELFTRQVRACLERVKNGTLAGVVFCSGAIGDADLETNRILKRLVAQYGGVECDAPPRA